MKSLLKEPFLSWFAWVFSAVVILGVYATCFAVYFFPLQISSMRDHWALQRAGVQEVESAGLKGYLKDQCPQGPSLRRPCPCVALIHGLGDSAMTWKKILLGQRQNGKEWEQSFRIYAFDLPGFGQSSAPQSPEGFEVRALAEKMREALAPLCSSWILVGNSLGGWIATWMALDWREGVQKLVLIGSGGLKRSMEEGSSLFTGEVTVEKLREFQSRAYFKPRQLPSFVWRAVAKRAKSGSIAKVITRQSNDDYLDDRAGSLTVPTLLLWGAADRVVPPEAGRLFDELIPVSHYVEIPQCGHLPQKECPEAVFLAIEQALFHGTF